MKFKAVETNCKLIGKPARGPKEMANPELIQAMMRNLDEGTDTPAGLDKLNQILSHLNVSND